MQTIRFATVTVVVLAVASPGLAGDAGGVVGSPLCPRIENARLLVKIDGVEVRAPATAEATTEAMTRLTSADRDERLRSAISLALAGDLDAFSRILESRDLANLSTYGRSYVNRDGLACVDPSIEAALVKRMGDPELRPVLTAFFENNVYRSRELFDLLVVLGFEDGKPRDFNRVVMAMLATRLEDIEAEVLEQAERNMVHDTPVRKRVLPGVHRRYVEFFGERGYEPATGYMEELLLAEGWSETVDSFVSEFSQTRSRVYRTLDGFGSPAAADVLIRQLERVADRCPPELVDYELAALGSFAVAHATTDEQKARTEGALAALLGLETPEITATPASTDYRRHSKLVKLLSSLGTDAAADTLVADLRRLARLEDPAVANPLIVSSLEAVRFLPEDADLDVPAFLEVADELPAQYRLHSVPEILDAHPNPASHSFYLARIRWIADNWDGFEARFGVDPETALDSAIGRLMEFDDPELLSETRSAIDALYLGGRLDERRFLATSAELNAALGDESPVYGKLREDQRIARENEERQRRMDAAAEWVEIVDENTSAEGIHANLEALNRRGDRSRLAASWLVIAGTDALAPAHQMLADPDTPDEAGLALLQIIGEIGDPESVRPVIDFIREHAENGVYLGAGLRALALMPPTEETFDFARELLGDSSSPIMKQQSLVYLASVRETRAEAMARSFSTADTDPDVRVAALLLAARLGEESIRPGVTEMIRSTDDRSRRDVLLRCLAEISDPAAFDAFGESSPEVGGSASFREMRTLVAFRAAAGDLKLEAARELVASGHPWDRREAIGFLVEENHIEVISRYLRIGPFIGQPLLRSVLHAPHGVQTFAQIRRMGYRIEDESGGLRLVAVDGRKSTAVDADR